MILVLKCIVQLLWTACVLQALPVNDMAAADDGICNLKIMFNCNRSNKCIFLRNRCNGINECPNGEDERGCPVNYWPTKTTQPSTTQSAGHGCYMCVGGLSCIHSTYQCDGHADCPNGDDEVDCRSIDDDPSTSGHSPWMWPVMSTVAGLVGGALLCTATALLVQRYRRVRRERRRQLEQDYGRHSDCAGTAAAARSEQLFRTAGSVGPIGPPSYADALERAFAATNPVYLSMADTPPKYLDIVSSATLETLVSGSGTASAATSGTDAGCGGGRSPPAQSAAAANDRAASAPDAEPPDERR